MKRQWIVMIAGIMMLVFAGASSAWAAPASYALNYEFPGFQPPASGTSVVAGELGGLTTTLSMTVAGSVGCAAGSTCGTFDMTATSAQFGMLSGQFSCTGGGCSFTISGATGVFKNVTASGFSLSTATSSGALATSFRNHGEWVSTVAHTAAMMKADGQLPGDVTVGDLVSQAAHNKQETQTGGSQGGQQKGNSGNGNGNSNAGGNGNGNAGGNGNDNAGGNGNGNAGGNGNGNAGGNGNGNAGGNGNGNAGGNGNGNAGGNGNGDAGGNGKGNHGH